MVTAVAVIVDGVRVAVDAARSTVWFEPIDDARLDWYTGIAEPYDKAGGYALQGAGSLFADRVEGSISNVIGLPSASAGPAVLAARSRSAQLPEAAVSAAQAV